MAAVVLKNFGGMAPSADPKKLPDGGATYARNLDLRFADFRPLPTPAPAATVAAGATLYKFETTGGFITRAGEVNFVRGPIPTDTTERTYYTGDGAPKVTDNTGDVRQLGVPRPAAAPAVVVNATAQYSRDDAAAAQSVKTIEFCTTINQNLNATYVGLTDAELAADFVAGPGDAPWQYYFKIPGTLTGGVFTPTNAHHRALMTDDLGFYLATSGGVTTGYAGMKVRGYQMALDASLATDLAALTSPAGGALLTSDQISKAVTSLTDDLTPANTARDAAIVRLRAVKDAFVALASSGSTAAASSAGAVADFYASTPTATAINDAVDRAVAAIFSAMDTFNAA